MEGKLPQFEPIGSRIKRLRMERGIAQEQLSIEAHVDQSGLSKFERGGRGVGEAPLRRIANVLGISFEELTAGTDFVTASNSKPKRSG